MPDLTEQLAEIKTRAEAATPGPWRTDREYDSIYSVDCMSNPPDYDFPTEFGDMRVTVGRNDAEFIAHSREDVARLIAAVEAVLAIHRDEDGDCDVCEPLAWPCPTARSITAALAGES